MEMFAKKVRLGGLADIRVGLLLPPPQAGAKGGIRRLTLRAMRGDGAIDLSLTETIAPPQGLNSDSLTKKGEIVVKLFAPFNPAVVAKECEGLLVPSQMAFIRLLAPASPERRLLPEFLCYCLSREDFVKSELARISGASTQTSLRAVKIRELREFLIPLPPAEKQTAFCELWRKHLERRKAARELEQLREEQIAAAFDSISSI